MRLFIYVLILSHCLTMQCMEKNQVAKPESYCQSQTDDGVIVTIDNDAPRIRDSRSSSLYPIDFPERSEKITKLLEIKLEQIKEKSENFLYGQDKFDTILLKELIASFAEYFNTQILMIEYNENHHFNDIETDIKELKTVINAVSSESKKKWPSYPWSKAYLHVTVRAIGILSLVNMGLAAYICTK